MNTLTYSQLNETVNKLVTGTASGKLKWMVDVETGVLTTSTKKFRFELSARDRDDMPPFVFKIILQPTAENPESVSATHIQTFLESDNEGPLTKNQKDLNEGISNLYATAKFSLSGIKDLVAELFEDLDE